MCVVCCVGDMWWSQNAFERDNFLPLNEIGLCARNLLTILGYIVNSIGGDLTCEGTQYDSVLVVQNRCCGI